MTDDHSAELLLSHVNLYAYGCDLIREDNAVLSPYGLLHRADYQPMLSPMQETQKMESCKQKSIAEMKKVPQNLRS